MSTNDIAKNYKKYYCKSFISYNEDNKDLINDIELASDYENKFNEKMETLEKLIVKLQSVKDDLKDYKFIINDKLDDIRKEILKNV